MNEIFTGVDGDCPKCNQNQLNRFKHLITCNNCGYYNVTQPTGKQPIVKFKRTK